MGKLEDIAERNQRALRDTRNKLVWVALIVAGLVAIAVALSLGLGVPKAPPHRVKPPPAHDHVDGVLLRGERTPATDTR